MAFKVISQLPD